MLKTIDRPTPPPPAPSSHSKAAYGYLLRVPLAIGAVFVLLPWFALRPPLDALFLGLFDVSGIGVWAVATSAFMLSLALMTTWFMVTAYGDQRCGAAGVDVRYPVHTRWYAIAAATAVPTLAAVFSTGGGSFAAFLGWSLAGLLTAVAIYEAARGLMRLLDVSALRGLARWLCRRPELGAGYVDLQHGTFLPGHRLAVSLMLLSAGVYAVIGRVMKDPNASEVPTLAYVLLLLLILCWILAGLAFFLDRYRIPLALPIAALVIATGTSGGSDHYFKTMASWHTERVSPTDALSAHPPGAAPPRSAVIVAANGGGIQAAAWTARVLTGLQEECRAQLGPRCRFAESVRLISSVSGGSVGAMYVTAAYDHGTLPDTTKLERIVLRAEASSLEHVGWGLLYRDIFRPLYPHFDYEDRGSALEEAWQREVDLNAPLESWRDDVRRGERPANIFNATISDSGERFLMGTANPQEAEGRRNFERLFAGYDLSVVTAARLSAAFTYVSPAARADTADEASVHFVDGGYYDVYGVSSVLDWLDEALRTSGAQPPPVSRVMLVQLRGAAPDRQPKGRRRGWFYQAYAPVDALLGARDIGQLSHDEDEVALLQRALGGRVALSSAIFQFCGGSPPLSWHMTDSQKTRIADEWAKERRYRSTQAVLDFLRADDTSTPATVVSVQPRCLPAPVPNQQ
jgi:patatin-like phospholipase